MNESPEASDSPRQKSSVFVFGRHDHAISLKALEVFGERERNAGTTASVGGVRHCILLQLWNIRDARILYTPDLFRIFTWIRYQCWLSIDTPAIDSIRRTRSAKMRQSPPVFHAAKQQGISVGQPCRARIEDTVDRVGPILPAEDRIRRMTYKQRINSGYLRMLLFNSEVFR